MLVSGAGATWTISGALNVGSGNTGSLIIDAGGSVSCGDGFIGNNEFAVNTLASAEVKGAGSAWTLERLRIGGLLGRAGTLEIEDRGTVSVDQSIEIKTGGRLEFLGGTLDAQSISFEGFGAFFWQTGTLHVGNYDGYLTNSAGTLRLATRQARPSFRTTTRREKLARWKSKSAAVNRAGSMILLMSSGTRLSTANWTCGWSTGFNRLPPRRS